MTDSWASSPASRAVMRANRGRDTGPEMRVRRLVHAAGLRYRVNARPSPQLRATADLLFTRVRVAVFVDGCFWHGCPEHYRPARSNAEFWAEKIEGNRRRDQAVTEALGSEGWTVIRVWEHEDPYDVAARVVTVVRSATPRATTSAP